MEFHHVPVLLNECIEGLSIRPDGTYADGTLGGGGHSSEIWKRLGSGGTLVGIDRDEAAIKAAGERLTRTEKAAAGDKAAAEAAEDSFGEFVIKAAGSEGAETVPVIDMKTEDGRRLAVVRGNYCQLGEILEKLGISAASGILLDLGVSSYQLDEAERGFSYMHDAPLDMRMDRRQALTAADIVNEYPKEDLVKILRDYGEEKFAAKIADGIIKSREKKRIGTTLELSRIADAAIPQRAKKTGGHPAKRTFQAIRIELNDELGGLDRSLDGMIDALEPGGRLVIITFHSLEDRIVKNAFRRNENPCICPPEFPVCVCGRKPKGRVITRKPIPPTQEEMDANPRAKSAKLRIFEKAAGAELPR